MYSAVSQCREECAGASFPRRKRCLAVLNVVGSREKLCPPTIQGGEGLTALRPVLNRVYGRRNYYCSTTIYSHSLSIYHLHLSYALQSVKFAFNVLFIYIDRATLQTPGHATIQLSTQLVLKATSRGSRKLAQNICFFGLTSLTLWMTSSSS